MRYLFVFGLILFSACKVIPQSKKDMVKIVRIIVYKNFQVRGYTTAGAFTHFDDMKREGTELMTLSNEDIKVLEQILNTAKQSKHYQKKFGIYNTFFEFYEKDKTSIHKCILGKGTNLYVLTDLTSRVEYHISKVEDVKYIEDLLIRLKATCD